MHVLVISRSFPHHRAGGLEWTSQDLVDGLMAAGHRVSVVTTPRPKVPALMPLTVNGDVVELGGRSGAYDARFFWELQRGLAKLAARLGVDVVHAQGFAGVLTPRGVPSLTTIHGTLWSETPLRGRPLPKVSPGLLWRYKHRLAFAPLWRWFLRHDRPLAVDSAFSRAELEREAGRPLHRVGVVPLGFDLGRFPAIPREGARQRLGIPQDLLLFLSVGRLESIKRPRWVLEGFAQVACSLPNARLMIVGDGPERSLLKEAAERLGPAVELPGRVEAGRLPLLLAAADLFLNADHGSPAFGLANAEALVMGARVLTTDSGAHREVVLKEDGRLSPMNDLIAWKAAFAVEREHLPEESSIRAQRSQRARQRFSRDQMVTGYVELYDRVLAGW
jgi:glycosyltransferase involved in cell wall biosynthesis